MKRRLIGSFALVAVLAVVATACGGGEEEAASGSPSASGAAGVTTLEQGVLTVGSCLDYPPFESVKSGTEVGFDVDLVNAIADKLGLEVKWVRANFDTIFTSVAGNQFDMVAAAVTATGDTGAKRAQIVAFSDYYYNSRQSLSVSVEKTPDITSWEQLGQGDTVGVQKGTTGAAWAEQNLVPKGVTIKTYTGAPDAFRDLQAGVITGAIVDEPAAAGIVEQFPGTQMVQPIDTNEKYAFAFAKNTPDLVTAVNQALQQVIDDGTYAAIYATYFPGAPVPEEFQPAT